MDEKTLLIIIAVIVIGLLFKDEPNKYRYQFKLN